MSNLPSVTQILSPYTDFSMVPPERLELAAARGTRLHKFIAMSLKDEWFPPAAIHAEIEGYWESFMTFKEKMIEKTIFVEKELVCDKWGFVGHLDFAGILKGEKGIAVLDWKSPICEGATWIAQCCAYSYLVEEYGGLPDGLKVTRCGALMLSPKGKPPKLKEYTHSRIEGFNAFLCALGAYQYFCKR